MNDAMFILDHEVNPELYKSSSSGNAENLFPFFNQCNCIQSKKIKNKIVSKVI
jgi:hypothetical protein